MIFAASTRSPTRARRRYRSLPLTDFDDGEYAAFTANQIEFASRRQRFALPAARRRSCVMVPRLPGERDCGSRISAAFAANEVVICIAVIFRDAAHKLCMRDFLGFTSHAKWRSAILAAAVSFAAFHILAIATPPVSLQSELIHFAAVLLRFLLPCACFLAGVASMLRLRH